MNGTGMTVGLDPLYRQQPEPVAGIPVARRPRVDRRHLVHQIGAPCENIPEAKFSVRVNPSNLWAKEAHAPIFVIPPGLRQINKQSNSLREVGVDVRNEVSTPARLTEHLEPNSGVSGENFVPAN